MNWTKATVAAIGALALIGCYHKPKDPPPVPAVHTAKLACEVDSLAREHTVLVSEIEKKSVSETIAMEKMREFRAEVDASYRFVVENCTAYNLCMQTHGYVEEKCGKSREAWEASHERFNELTIRLAELDRWRPRPRPRPRPDHCDVGDFATGDACHGSPNENY